MANPGLLTALGTLGAGLSTYGQVRREKDALARALEEQAFQRDRLAREEQRLVADRAAADAERNRMTQRQTSRDILDAILGGLRPQGMQSMQIGGQRFELPEVLTENERINQRKLLFKAAYPQLNDAQAELLARQAMRPGEAIVDPGVAPRPRTTTTTLPTNPMDQFIVGYTQWKAKQNSQSGR